MRCTRRLNIMTAFLFALEDGSGGARGREAECLIFFPSLPVWGVVCLCECFACLLVVSVSSVYLCAHACVTFVCARVCVFSLTPPCRCPRRGGPERCPHRYCEPHRGIFLFFFLRPPPLQAGPHGLQLKYLSKCCSKQLTAI